MKRILFWFLLLCWFIPGVAYSQIPPRAVEVLGTGTAGSAATQVITVQGIASGTVVPVSGTITANAGTNLNTSALALDTSVDGIEALLTTIDADTGSILSDTTAILADTAAIQTAVELIDDSVATLGTTTYTEATTKGLLTGCVRNDTLASLGNTDNEIVPCQADADGAIYVNLARGGGQVEDSIVGSGDSGMPGFFNHDPTPAAATPSAIGDYSMAAVDGFQSQYVTLTDAAGAAVDASTIGGGVQYTEGDAADTTITMTMAGMEISGNLFAPLQGSVADGQLVNLGTNNDVVVTNAGTFVVQEDGAALTALQLIDNAISGAGFNITQQGGVAVSLNTGVRDTGTQRVTIATDDSVPVTGTFWQATQPVSGTVTVTATNLDVQIGGSDTLTVAAHAVTNAGTFVVQEDGAALTALQLIDDTVVAQGTALGSTKNLMIGGSVTTSAPTYTTGQIHPFSLDTGGALRVTGGGGGTEYVTNAAVPTDPTGTTLVMEIDTVLSTLSTEVAGEWTNTRSTAEGALWVQDFNSDAILSDTTAILADTAAIQTAVELIDNAISGAGFNITQQGGVNITLNTGAVTTGTQRVTLATDDVLNVVCDSGCAGGTQYVDDTATHATGTTLGTAMVAAATPTDGSVDANDLGVVAMSLDRRLHVDADITASVALDVSAATVTVAATNLDVQIGGSDTLTVAAHDVTNAGTFAVQVVDTSFAVADGSALGEGVLMQGDDGTDRKNINVDATTGDVQVDVTNTVTVSATNLDVQIGGSDTVTVTATNLDVQSGGADLATAAGQLADGHNVALSATDNAVLDTIDAQLDKLVVDPCASTAKSFFVVDVVNTTLVNVATASASDHVHICSINLVTNAANNVALVEDTTSLCASPTAGLSGGTTAAEGWNFAANGGLTQGNGRSTIMRTATVNHYVCLAASASTQLSGHIAYVQAP